MLWFKRKKYERDKVAERVSVEVSKHNRDKSKAVAEARRATESLDEVIRRNGFTLKIHKSIVAGGKN